MENQNKTIRLVYPQWQGGNIAQWITEVKDPEQASRGYYLGAQLLNFLAPNTGQPTFTVPVSTEIVKREVTDGVMDKDALIAQTKAIWHPALDTRGRESQQRQDKRVAEIMWHFQGAHPF